MNRSRHKSEVELVIGVPVYNSQNSLSKCLDSILEQEGLKELNVNLNIICVNDGSTDDSLRIMEDYERNYSCIRVINCKNQGAYMARMRIAKEANGDWIGFVDSDDVIEKGMYSSLISPIIKDEEVDLSVCAFRRETKSGKYKVQMASFGEKILDVKRNPEYLQAINPSFCNKLFRLSIVKQTCSLLSKRMAIAEDVWFNAAVYPMIRKVAFTNQALYIYHNNLYSVTKEIGLNQCYEAEVGFMDLINLYKREYPQYIGVLEGLLVTHLGIAFTITCNSYSDSIVQIWRETIRFMNENLSGWNKNKIYAFKNLKKKELLKVVITGRLYQTKIWVFLSHIYRFLNKKMNLDIRW